MIVMKQKDVEWILDRLAPFRKVVVLGCGSCAAVCLAGGEREVEELCCSLQLALRDSDATMEFEGLTCKRVCDWEFVEPIADALRAADAVVTLACGAGANLIADQLEDVRIIPGVDTSFLASNTGPDTWDEVCAGCGNCMIDQTFGICPVARCAKTLMNGPCGGSSNGKCELGEEVECVWAKIVERGELLGRLNELEEITPPKDWSTGRHGGQRRLNRADLGIQRLSAEEFDEG